MDRLEQEALSVLRRNDQGSWTRPSPRLYPHQWSWDAAFVAIGWAHVDVARGLSELRHLLRGQWSTGMIPHVVFDPDAPPGTYAPGADDWHTDGHAPAGVRTSGICQPPVHAIALRRIRHLAVERGRDAIVDAALTDLYPALDRWHRWLRTARDPDGTGLVTILHPWESGLDNSPRWDAALARIEVDDAEAPPRPDLSHVEDPHQRPTDGDYRRYHHLVDRLIAVDHDQAAAMARHPFRMADVWFSAILAAADDALADLAEVVGDVDGARRHREDAARTRDALDQRRDPATGRCCDLDLISGDPVTADTIASFAPLVAGTSVDRTAVLVERLWSASYAGSSRLVDPLPTSTAADDPAFSPTAYWRGPQWPPMTWLLWWALERSGHRRSAERLRQTALAQLARTGCTEYVDPLTGGALGSDAQSWTAAVALDWLTPPP